MDDKAPLTNGFVAHDQEEKERDSLFNSISRSLGSPSQNPPVPRHDITSAQSAFSTLQLSHRGHLSGLSRPGTPGSSLLRPDSPSGISTPIDFDGLSWPSAGALGRLNSSEKEQAEREQKIANAVKTILECLGEDPTRQGLAETPKRYAKAMLFFTKGYEQNLRDLMNNAIFEEDHDELVIVKDIEVFSLCEHHLVPFTGKMAIGYIPNRRVLGLSKLARIAEMFARRLQLQERLTKQVAQAVQEVLKPQGVAVVMESSHLCMVMRGVQKTGAVTTTSCMLGKLRASQKTRDEFLRLVKG